MKKQTRQITLLIVAASLILLIFFSNNNLPTGNVAAPQQRAVQRFAIVYASNPPEQADITPHWPLSPGRFTIDFKRNFAHDMIEGLRRCDYYLITMSKKFTIKTENFCKFEVGDKQKTIGPFVMAASGNRGGFPARTIEVDVINPSPGTRGSEVGFHVLYKLVSTNDWEWGKYCTISTDDEMGQGRLTCRVNLPRTTNIYAVMVARAASGPGASVSVTDIRLIS